MHTVIPRPGGDTSPRGGTPAQGERGGHQPREQGDTSPESLPRDSSWSCSYACSTIPRVGRTQSLGLNWEGTALTGSSWDCGGCPAVLGEGNSAPAVPVWGDTGTPEGQTGNFPPWDDAFVAGVHPAQLFS